MRPCKGCIEAHLKMRGGARSAMISSYAEQ